MQALEGVERLFLLMPSSAQVRRAMQSCGPAKQKRSAAYREALAVQANPTRVRPFRAYHGAVEAHIRKLRNRVRFCVRITSCRTFNFRPTMPRRGVFYACAGTRGLALWTCATLPLWRPCAYGTGHEGKTYESRSRGADPQGDGGNLSEETRRT